MSWSDDYDEPDGTCEDCGLDLSADPGGDHDDNHRQCWKCWRKAQGFPEQPWRRPQPAPDEPPVSFVEGLSRVREELRAVQARVARLEQRTGNQ